MKTLFWLVALLTENDHLRGLIDTCFTAGVASVVLLALLGGYQALRRTCPGRHSGAASRA